MWRIVSLCCLLVIVVTTSPGAYLPSQTAPKTSTEEDDLYHQVDMTDNAAEQDTLEQDDTEQEKEQFEKIDIAGDYDKYSKSIKKYEEYEISKDKKDALRQEIDQQY